MWPTKLKCSPTDPLKGKAYFSGSTHSSPRQPGLSLLAFGRLWAPAGLACPRGVICWFGFHYSLFILRSSFPTCSTDRSLFQIGCPFTVEKGTETFFFSIFESSAFFFFNFINERHRERGRDTGRGRSRLPVESQM